MDKVQQTDAHRQNELVSAMLQPDFYPNCPAEVTHKETHISHLFFAGDVVYKIKKAVRFSFWTIPPSISGVTTSTKS